jgi:NitT/TauT family transport system substrate-binding protein
MKSLLWLIPSFILTAMLILVPSSWSQDRVYKIGMSPWAAWAALNVADVQGLWEKEGVKVKVINFADDREKTNALEKGLIDFSFSMLGTAFSLTMGGTPVVVLAETDWSNGGDKIIVKEGIDLTQTKGKAIGVYLNEPSITFFLNKYLSLNGMKTVDFKVLEIDNPVSLTDKFINGVIPAFIHYEPEATRGVTEGKGTVVATTADYPGCMPEGMVVLIKNLKDIPESDITAILKGYIQAESWMKQEVNWAEFAKILNEKTFPVDDDMSDEDLKSMLADVVIHDASGLMNRNQTGGGMHIYMNEVKQFLSDSGELKTDFNVADMINTTALMKALK